MSPRPTWPRRALGVLPCLLLGALWRLQVLTATNHYPDMPTTAPADLSREDATAEARRLRSLAADPTQSAKVQADARHALHNLHMARHTAADSNARYARLYQTHAGRLPR